MKLFSVFMTFSWIFINVQEIQGWKNKPKLQQIFEVFVPTNSCEYQLVEPLDALLYADQETWNEVCNGSEVYFHNCRDRTMIDCGVHLAEATCSTYMFWIDAFVAGGTRFTCSYAYEDIKDISDNHGGHSCTYTEVNDDLSKSVDDILAFLSTPKSIQCRDIERYMNATLTVLDDCESKSMMNLVQEYFEQVLNYSPCPDDAIGPASGALSGAANAMFIISVALFYAAISFIS